MESKSIKERLATLLSIKSLVTIILTSVFAYLSMVGVVDAEKFMTIFAVVISFYFGTQAIKE
ncbi:hypothetical protein [Gudongella sp. SC589]|uniref:hypothetical protein n=1 Tax=Gudongella sp. SC589 TaxID=3385990 RepID=UPI003904A6AB